MKDVGTGKQLYVCVTIEISLVCVHRYIKQPSVKMGRQVRHAVYLFSIILVRDIALYISSEIRQRKSKAYRRGAEGEERGGGVK
jgi:hypothetical protein